MTLDERISLGAHWVAQQLSGYVDGDTRLSCISAPNEQLCNDIAEEIKRVVAERLVQDAALEGVRAAILKNGLRSGDELAGEVKAVFP